VSSVFAPFLRSKDLRLAAAATGRAQESRES
jgi:hypothetical protein